MLPALVVGDTSQMPSLLTSDMKDSGLAHLTAVSGANVAIVVGAVLLVARVLGVRAYWLVSLGLVSVCWFVVLARPQPSVLRAAVMGSLALVPLGYLLAGPIGEAIGPAETVLIGGTVGVAIAALGFAIPDVWRLRALSSTT